MTCTTLSALSFYRPENLPTSRNCPSSSWMGIDITITVMGLG